MSLTTWWLLTVLGVIAAGSLVATVALWDQLAGGEGRRWAGRAGLIFVVQVSGVALLAGIVNAQNDFYPTLGSLIGRGPGTGQLQAAGDAPTAGWVSVSTTDAATTAIVHPVHTPTGSLWLDPDNASYGAGTTLQADLSGPLSHQYDDQVRIWLPPQYTEPAYRNYRFPVVVGLTGYPGNSFTWWHAAQLPQMASAAIAQHRIAPFVAVVLTPDLVPPRDTECANVPRGPQVQTFLARDLPDDLQRMVRVVPPGPGWAIIGDSTGGYCSVLLSLRYPHVYPTAVSLAGYFHAITDFTTGNLDGGSKLHKELRDPTWLATHTQAPSISLLLAGATGDSTSVPDLEAFARIVREPTVVDTLISPGGGHNWETWTPQMISALGWIGSRIVAPPLAGAGGGGGGGSSGGSAGGSATIRALGTASHRTGTLVLPTFPEPAKRSSHHHA
jgi:S-formylglutathione hydrolase FrmB